MAEAYRSSTVRLFTHRLKAIAEVPGFERLRDAGREVKRHTIENLDYYLAQFADSVERNGGKMHWASTAAEVCRIVVDIVQRSAAREVVKAKTMVGEEVELNHALEAAGIRAIETDLGEFIIQLAGERPAHIVAPAIHKTREEVSDLFVEHIEVRAHAGSRGTHRHRPPGVTRNVPESRRGSERRQLRRGRDGNRGHGRERREHPHVHHRSAGAHRA